ncbi:MAG: hypothetical protein N0C84_16890 [Candidatus Thiodiazotropha taylori]|uniref:Uncharacterized protein n=1 Tax=Candidatus Thiodiazotropha taylori TaxID=2792791 RepID=A0A9E4T6E4_9GAMM|nr:hypothetical protein [Candidatus Thiodiazotropha taylori]MCW4258143.1 hypothetical protein [Candidatus Thiodiazotropha taylori]
MPCNSNYMKASGKEVAISQVACLLDELDGKPINRDYWRGYHPLVYNRIHDADALVAELCGKLQKVDVSQYSLEMQIWWRDHQQADKDRLEREIQSIKEEKDKEAALSKLTDYEKRLLGLTP